MGSEGVMPGYMVKKSLTLQKHDIRLLVELLIKHADLMAKDGEDRTAGDMAVELKSSGAWKC